MAQFDVYPNPVEELRDSHPYVVGIQSDLLRRPVGVITVALARLDAQREPANTLNPWLDVGGETLVLETLAITSFEPSDLRRPVANLQSQAQVIWDALEYALHGY
jgi:hypothetical protein